MSKVKFVFRNFMYLIISTVFTATFATLIQTQRVICSLNEIGAVTKFSERLLMSFYDLLHLGTLYGVFIFLAFLTAFFVSGLVYKMVGFGRILIFTMSGGIAIFIMLLLMKKMFFDVHIIAGARDISGILLQILAGVFGGFVFGTLKSYKSA